MNSNPYYEEKLSGLNATLKRVTEENKSLEE